MPRHTRYPDAIYIALDKIRDTALVRFDSLFTPERRLWTAAGLQRFHQLFVQRFDEGEGDFFEKFSKQLKGADNDTYQLAAELLYVQQFFTSLTGGPKKIKNVETVLSWMERPIETPQWAIDATAVGLAGDQSFNQHRPFHLAWLTEFLIYWHALPADRRRPALDDPWVFREVVFLAPTSHKAYQPMREAWLYLIFPDYYEAISSRKDKRTLLDIFGPRLGHPKSDIIDRDLFEIRNILNREYGVGWSYYRDPLLNLWWRTEAKQDPTLPVKPKRTSPEPTDLLKTKPANPVDLVQLAEDLYLEPADCMQEWADLLLESKQIIFQGPPGTGKTYIARRLANAVAGDPSRVQVIQFHPSYAYEDFVEGYRPTGVGSFELRDGPLKRLAAAAAANPSAHFVLLIDELNRGNLAKVFGELYFLLEYRDEPISLQYSDKPFQLPPNVLLIGTMNTADRSIALLDMAMRRRFKFVDLFPDRPPIRGLLRRFLERRATPMTYLAEMLDHVNEQLADPNIAVGPSHFLLKDTSNLTEATAERIWRHAILPALADRLFDQSSEAPRFAYEYVRTKVDEAAESSVASTLTDAGAGDDDA